MSHEIIVTVTGYVATEPRLIVSRNGTEITTFRMASTPRRYDRTAESWVDGATQWFTVKSFRRCAANISASLKKGDPVLVLGRLTSSEWDKDGQHFHNNEIEAFALGHDLMLGRSTFLKVSYEKKEEEPVANSPEDSISAAFNIDRSREAFDDDDDDDVVEEDEEEAVGLVVAVGA